MRATRHLNMQYADTFTHRVCASAPTFERSPAHQTLSLRDTEQSFLFMAAFGTATPNVALPRRPQQGLTSGTPSSIRTKPEIGAMKKRFGKMGGK